MLNGILHEILRERLGDCDYEVWTSSNWADWVLIEVVGSRESTPPRFTEIRPLQHPKVDQESKDCMLVFLPYNNNICVAIRLFKSWEYSAEDLVTLSSLLYPYYSEAVASKHERALNEIMNSIRDVTQLLDLNELLGRILVSALSVIPYECIGVLWRYDPAIDALTVKARAGEMGEGMLRMKLKPGEGIIGSTFKRGTPKLYNSLSNVEDDFGNMTLENKYHLNSAYDFHNIGSIISVPIKVEGQPDCVLIVYQKGKVPIFTESDVRLLQSFADQVSIAITNAKLYESLSRQNETLIKRDEIHSSLMRLSLQNKGAVSIVSELTRVIGVALTFVDFIDNEWTPKRGKVIHGWSVEKLRSLYESLRHPDYLTWIKGKDEQAHQYLYPIASANQCLGYLIIQMNTLLEPLQLVALEQGSSILALELMRKQSLAEFYFKKTQQLFNDLRLSQASEDYWNKSGEIGIGPSTSIVVGLMEFADQVNPSTLSVLSVQLISYLREKMPAGTLPIAFGNERRVTVLLMINESNKPGMLEQQFSSLLPGWESRNHVKLFGGLSSVRSGVDAINTGYQEADKALAYQKTRGEKEMIRYTDIGVNRLFIRQSAEDLSAFIAEVFEPLRPAKGQAGGLEETLMTYMACGGSAVQAATALHIHINTLYQRIHKIEEILGMSLNNQEHMLHLQLACYLRQTYRT
ncbi:GAF domain-containing protein [Paenibacillus pabuli]|uniref:GAF domain-containing protein n=1 Tax=Paenibacillus pabuli TaxID=1472 RepID=A0ABX9BS87_9BACL|nr:helix-turn-helix domain-containing protein [Paenibacillus pabuli]RAJ02972.1 GAF domain-containing protein [Paenibacillus pabuli]